MDIKKQEALEKEWQEKQRTFLETFLNSDPPSGSELAEFEYASNDWDKIHQCKMDITRWERLEQAAPTPNEAIQAEQKLMALRQELKQLLALVAPAGAVGQPAPQPPVEADSVLSSSRLMKRKSLIQELEHKWPSIQADLSEASRNGLKQAAHSEQHRAWDAEKAEVWAKSKGKIGGTTLPTPSWCHGPVTRHTIDN